MSGGIDQGISVLFVCLGNICRSPMAEGAFRAAAERSGLECHVDSAGTAGYHVGSPPDPRAVEVAGANGIDIAGQAARQIMADDFHRFTHIIAMDRANLEGLRARAPRDGTAKLALLMDSVEGLRGQAVADPYYGTLDDFAHAWTRINEGVEALAARIIDEGAASAA
jgi:protein-tyrosine phosphatase